MGLSNIEDILQAGLDGTDIPEPESRIAELLKEWIDEGGKIEDILVAGSNITLTKNDDGTITIAASGEVSSEDTVAREAITAMKDGTSLDSFGDVETALSGKQDTIDDLSDIRTGAGKGATAVQPESGKGLSTNDFTDTLKTKLDGIAAGAEVNVQANWEQTDNTADDYIKGKPTIPTVPTAYTSTPAMDGVGSAGSSTSWAKGDHVHPSDTSKQNTTFTSYTVPSAEETITSSTTVQDAIEQLDYRTQTNKTNISLIKQVPTVGSSDNGKVLTAGTNGEYSWVTIDKDFIEGFLYNDNFYSDYSHTTEITGDFDKIYLDLHTDNIYYFDGSGTGDKYHYIGLKPYESKSAASGGTDVSLCTTGEKYTWNNKSNLQLTSSTTPIVDGTATIGSSTYAAKADHVHPTDTSRQAAITAQSPLSADVVSDTNTTHKFATQTQLDQISTNATNILWSKTTVQYSATVADTYEYTGLSVACPANTILEIWAIDDNSNSRITAIAVTDSNTSIDTVGAVIGENTEPLSMDAGAQWTREVHCVTPRLYGSVHNYYVWVKRVGTGANNVTLLTRKVVTQ